MQEQWNQLDTWLSYCGSFQIRCMPIDESPGLQAVLPARLSRAQIVWNLASAICRMRRHRLNTQLI